MNKVEAIRKLNETELGLGIAGTSASWHQEYATCPFIYVGGLPTAYTEGDLLAIFEQYGTVVHVNLVRDAETGKSRGFAFLMYNDPRSAVLAVDNFTGVEIAPNRTLRVDHARDYSIPEDGRSTALDTTPPELKEANTHVTNARPEDADGGDMANGGSSEAQTAEARREKAVLRRLKALRKQQARGDRERQDEIEAVPHGTETPSSPNRRDLKAKEDPLHHEHDGHAKQQPSLKTATRIDKHSDRLKKKQEKGQRKAERERIREERKKRRAEREKVS